MQLAYLVLPVLAGIALTALGVAPLGIPLVIVGVVVFVVRRRRAKQAPANNPAETDAPGIGFAHKGQGHMVP